MLVPWSTVYMSGCTPPNCGWLWSDQNDQMNLALRKQVPGGFGGLQWASWPVEWVWQLATSWWVTLVAHWRCGCATLVFAVVIFRWHSKASCCLLITPWLCALSRQPCHALYTGRPSQARILTLCLSLDSYDSLATRYLERIQVLKNNFTRAHVEAEKLNAKDTLAVPIQGHSMCDPLVTCSRRNVLAGRCEVPLNNWNAVSTLWNHTLRCGTLAFNMCQCGYGEYINYYIQIIKWCVWPQCT